MTAAQPLIRFDFAVDFDDPGVQPMRIKRSYTPQEVEDIRRAAYQEGEGSAVAKAEARATDALADIAQAVKLALEELAGIAHQHKSDAARLALACGKQIAQAALDCFPEAPAIAAVQALERELAGEPRLIVKAEPDLVERLQTALETAAREIGFSGAIEVRGDPALPPAAFVFDWGDGAAKFDPQQAALAVSEALEAALAAQAPIDDVRSDHE